MRVLFTTWAWPSHLYALLPLAGAFAAEGHEVLVATQPELAPAAAGLGFDTAPVGTNVDSVTMVAGYLLPRGAGNGSAAGRGRPAAKGPRVLEMFAAHAESMSEPLVRVARDWRPDLLVFDPTTWAGPIAAAAVGIPAVRHLYGVDLLQRAKGLAAQVVEPIAARFGLTGVDPFGDRTVDPVPPSLRVPTTDDDRLAVRYLPSNGPGNPLAPPPSSPSARPRIVVSWGHTMARIAPDRFLAGEVARAISGLDVDVVLAVSARQRELLGALGADVEIAYDVPLRRLVAGADLLIAHGGAGTVLTGLAFGVPQLLVPQLPDHAGHAARVLACGAGDVLTVDEATPQRVRAETERLLGDSAPRRAAQRLRDEISAQPSPAEVAARLVAGVRPGAVVR